MQAVKMLLVGAGLLFLAACTSRPTWGRGATLTPSWQRVQRAAITAATDPQTWAPLAGAALTQIGDVDDEIANWAREDTPLFGSTGTAEDVSDVLLAASGVGWGTSLLLTPSGRDLWSGLWPKAKGGAIEGVALGAQGYLVRWMKDVTNRERPDGSDSESFPSGHTYSVATFAALTRRHAEATPMTRWQRDAIHVSTTTATALTAWARMEGGRHHPSDVLVGWGLANFLNVFIHDAFIGRSRARFQVQQCHDCVRVGLHADL